MEHTSGASETRGAAGSFPGFWRDTKGEDAAAAGLASGAAAGVAAAEAGKGKSVLASPALLWSCAHS